MSATIEPSKKKSKKAINTKTKIEDVVAKPTSSPSASPEPTKKRKRDTKELEELEVDVTLPEPLSKKEARKAKKAKPSKSTSTKEDDTEEQGAEGAPKEEEKRSAHGIWIGNLSWTTTKALLNEFFTSNSTITPDQITRVHMPVPFKAAATKTQLKPQNKGFAYVDFTTEEVLAAAMELTESMLGGRRVLIKNARSFEGRPEKKEGVEVDSGPGAKPLNQKPPSKRVFVGNLSFDVTKEELSEHFNKAGKVLDLHMATFEDTGKCKGFSWVTFEELEAAESAVRGWTRIPVQGEEAASGSENDSDAEEVKKDGKNKKQKMRKWFINKLHGRPLRCEFAEDAQSRYKKRFGKEGKEGEAPLRGGAPADGGEALGEVDGEDKPKRSFKKKPRGDADIKPGAPTDFNKRRGRTAAAPSRDEAYKTGAITEAKGKKVTFD